MVTFKARLLTGVIGAKTYRETSRCQKSSGHREWPAQSQESACLAFSRSSKKTSRSNREGNMQNEIGEVGTGCRPCRASVAALMVLAFTQDEDSSWGSKHGNNII